MPADSHVLYSRRPPYWAVARWAHVAAFPKYEGDNSNDMKDPNGKLVQIELIKMAQERGSGWVDYLWPKPGQSQPSQKWAYVKAVKIDGSQGLWSGLLSSITETSGGSAAKRRLYETASILADGAVDCEGRKVIE